MCWRVKEHAYVCIATVYFKLYTFSCNFILHKIYFRILMFHAVMIYDHEYFNFNLNFLWIQIIRTILSNFINVFLNKSY